MKIKFANLDLKHEYSRFYSPVAFVEPGESLLIETEDAFNGQLNSTEDMSQLIAPGALPPNPLTGPIFVNGCLANDTLEIHIEEIHIGKQGAVCFAPTNRAIDTWFEGAYAKIFKIIDNQIVISEHLLLAADPFIGCIATASAYSSPASVQVMKSGGNMDCCLIKPGNILYLPVNVDGAYLYVGDVHALQADGEFCGTGVEVNAQVELRLYIKKTTVEQRLNCPRVETPTHMMTIAGGVSLDDANRIAFREMMIWLQTEFEQNPKDIFLELSQVANLRPCNWFTARCEVPKVFLNI